MKQFMVSPMICHRLVNIARRTPNVEYRPICFGPQMRPAVIDNMGQTVDKPGEARPVSARRDTIALGFDDPLVDPLRPSAVYRMRVPIHRQMQTGESRRSGRTERARSAVSA